MTMFIVALAIACDKDEKPSQTQSKAEAVVPESAKGTDPAQTVDAKQALEPVLAAYEKVRDDLAQDALSAVAADAGALANAAREAAPKAPSLEAQTKKLAKAADTLAGTPAADEAAVRKRFGEVSRHVVAIVTAEPALRQGRHLFECPMAEGYQKWVQTDEKLANPYMGTKMPECGQPSQWQS